MLLTLTTMTTTTMMMMMMMMRHCRHLDDALHVTEAYETLSVRSATHLSPHIYTVSHKITDNDDHTSPTSTYRGVTVSPPDDIVCRSTVTRVGNYKM